MKQILEFMEGSPMIQGALQILDRPTNKKDYFNYGGDSEFFGLSLSDQKIKIKNGYEKFVNEDVKIRSFFAPNHTYDKNTFIALKKIKKMGRVFFNTRKNVHKLDAAYTCLLYTSPSPRD